MAQPPGRPRRRARRRRRHRALAAPHRRPRPRPGLCRVIGGSSAGDALRGGGLCAFRAGEDATRGGCFLADRAVLATDHRRAGRGHAEELRLRQRRHARLFLQAAAACAARQRFRARLRQAPREDGRAAAIRAQGARVQMRRAMGDARRAVSCLCGAPPRAARRLCSQGFWSAHVSEPVSEIPADARPRLPRGVRLTHNEAQGGWVLLAPERVFKADQIAVEIIKRCTGEATFAAIIDDLVATFKAPRDRILADVTTLLRSLADKRLLEL